MDSTTIAIQACSRITVSQEFLSPGIRNSPAALPHKLDHPLNARGRVFSGGDPFRVEEATLGVQAFGITPNGTEQE